MVIFVAQVDGPRKGQYVELSVQSITKSQEPRVRAVRRARVAESLRGRQLRLTGVRYRGVDQRYQRRGLDYAIGRDMKFYISVRAGIQFIFSEVETAYVHLLAKYYRRTHAKKKSTGLKTGQSIPPPRPPELHRKFLRNPI